MLRISENRRNAWLASNFPKTSQMFQCYLAVVTLLKLPKSQQILALRRSLSFHHILQITGNPGASSRPSHHSKRRKMRDDDEDDDDFPDRERIRYDGQSATSISSDQMDDRMDGSNDSEELALNDQMMNMSLEVIPYSAPISAAASPVPHLVSPLRRGRDTKRVNDTETVRINTADLNEIEMDLNQIVQEDLDGALGGVHGGVYGQSQSEMTNTPIPALPSIQSSRELRPVMVETARMEQPASMGPVHGFSTVSTHSDHLELTINVNSDDSVRL